MKWEYDIFYPDQSQMQDIKKILNEKGSNGWEHYDTQGMLMLFKRRVEEEPIRPFSAFNPPKDPAKAPDDKNKKGNRTK